MKRQVTVQAKTSWRVLAFIIQVIGILLVITAVTNIFIGWFPWYTTALGVVGGIILYLAGTAGSSSVTLTQSD